MYNLSEAFKIVLLPDGNVSDLEEYESDDVNNTAQPVTIDSDKEVLLPGNVGPLQIERNEEIEFEEPFQILNISATIEDDLEDKRLTPSPQSSEKSGDQTPLLNQRTKKQGAKEQGAKKQGVKTQVAKKQYKWQKKALKEVDTKYDGQFSASPNTIPTPYEYFKEFIDDACIENIALQTNMYAIEINVTKAEVEQFFGILMYTGVHKAASYRTHWETCSRVSLIADVMSRNRFETILRYIHFNDNAMMKKKNDEGYDPLFKVRPLLDSLKESLSKIEPEERHSIDEQMIPFKGRSSLKQYMKNKPHKWGYKVFTRAGISGIVYDFEVYTGKNMNLEGALGLSGNIVLRMVENLQPNCHFKVYFDNFFASPDLVDELSKKQIWSVGTIRSNRMSGCTLAEDNVLKKKGRGSHDFQSDIQAGITIVKWYDNKPVHLISSFCGVNPVGTCKRWSKSEGKYIQVDQPKIVAEYNPFMGGVDLADMHIELYLIDLRSNRWYMRIVYFCFDLAVVNSWLLYQRHLEQNGKTKHIPLKDFRCNIAQALIKAGKSSKRKRGRRSTEGDSPKQKRQRVAVQQVADIRYDEIGHWPTPLEKKQRCKYCPTGYTRISCSKCNAGLCLNKSNNCFTAYHVR